MARATEKTYVKRYKITRRFELEIGPGTTESDVDFSSTLTQ